MAEKREKTRDEIIADWVQGEKAKARAGRKKRRLDDSEATVTINSLMDAMTIILIFLLMNYSMDPLRVDSSKDLKLPISNTELLPKKTLWTSSMLPKLSMLKASRGSASTIDAQ